MFQMLHFLVIFGLVFNQLLASAHGHHSGHHSGDHNEPISAELAHVHLGHSHSPHVHSSHAHAPDANTTHGHSHSSHNHAAHNHSRFAHCHHVPSGHADDRFRGADPSSECRLCAKEPGQAGFSSNDADETGCCLVIPVTTVTGHIVKSQSFDIDLATDLDFCATQLLAGVIKNWCVSSSEHRADFLHRHSSTPSVSMRLTRLCRLQL